METTHEDLVRHIENLFTYHAPKDDQPARYQAIREQAKQLALVILESTPACQERWDAIRFVQLASMTANLSIACNE